MERREFIKKGLSATAGIIAYSRLCNLCSGEESGSATIAPYTRNRHRKGYSTVEWKLHEDEDSGIKIYGATPKSYQDPKELEALVCTDKNPGKKGPREWEPLFADRDPREIELTEWDITALAKLVPVKRLIEEHSHYFSINPMWATMFFTYESLLKPADHNKRSNDFGLGQIKPKSERLAKTLGTNSKSKLYCPSLKKEGLIFEPETNIIMSMLLHRANTEKMNLKDSDQTYAIYAAGKAGLSSWGKKLTRASKNKVKGMRDRYLYYQNIIPLFRLERDEIADIENPDTRFLLELYHDGLGAQEMYQRETVYFLNDLEQNLTGDVRSVLVYDDCVTFERALETIWNHNERGVHGKLIEIGSDLSRLVSEDQELKDRVDKSMEVLRDRQIEAFEEVTKKKKRFIFF